MTAKNKPTASKAHNKTGDKKIVIGGDVVGHDIIIGNNNVVKKTTIIQKFFNIFKSDSETLEQRNRRILLGHVENAWIKGVLDASLHGAALLDLGIKPDPEAVTQYPWAIKKESTDETLPTGTSMLEIFDSIGMGRSLLILGAPGSGKTTMLLELARGLIARAREDVTQPIPIVFNLASWTEEKQILKIKKGFFNKKPSSEAFEIPSLGNWLVNELNRAYFVPQETALELIKANKLLLLLDGLDEVRQDNRAKCLKEINKFRKQNGLTSLAVCSRSQDYADLKAKLSFEGSIEVQPLTQKQITEFFNRFGKEMAGIKRVLEKDNALREMAETPLFLSIMLMAFKGKQDVEILISGDEKVQRTYLFDTYVERMFERSHSKIVDFTKPDILQWLSWFAQKMIEHNEVTYLIEPRSDWLLQKQKWTYNFLVGLINCLLIGLVFIGIPLAFSRALRVLPFGGFIGLIALPISGAILGLQYFKWLANIGFYIFRFILARNNLLPWKLVPFLNHCVDLIFLRRVGGGYIFVHRLLMEHFAEMYVETPTSKGN